MCKSKEELRLQEEILNIHKGEYLSEALKRQGYSMLPSNAIINKVMTGTGATYMELNPTLSPRNSIVIEPFRSAVEDKIQVYSQSQGVLKGVTTKKLLTYLKSSSIKFKKIITTPEGFTEKLLPAAIEANVDIFRNFFCLYDESEHITEDTGYRRRISLPMMNLFKFKEKALVSATPLKPTKLPLTLFVRNQFKWIEIRPDYDYKENLTLITTNNFYLRVKQKIHELLNAGSPHVCIFYKTTEGICNIVEYLLAEKLIGESDYKVFCSKESADKLKTRLLEHSTDKLELPLKRINLFTSRFFPSIDINLSKPCDILILSNYNHVKHSLINPFTEAIQCQGRFRNTFTNGKRYNSLTVISSIPRKVQILSENEIYDDVSTRIKCYRAILLKKFEEMKMSIQNTSNMQYFEKELKGTRLNDMLDDNKKNIDRFYIEQMLIEEQVKGYYTSAERLKEAYERTGYFNVTFIPEHITLGEDDIDAIKSAKAKERLKLIIETIENNKENPNAIRLLKAQFVKEEWIINAYFKLGKATIEQFDYKKTPIEKELVQFEIQEAKRKLTSSDFLLEMKSNFESLTGNNLFYPIEDILDSISSLLRSYGITFSRYGDGKKNTMCKLSANFIKSYFDTTCSNREGIAKIKLVRFKEELMSQEAL